MNAPAVRICRWCTAPAFEEGVACPVHLAMQDSSEDAVNEFIDLVGRLGESGIADLLHDALQVRADSCESHVQAEQILRIAEMVAKVRDAIAEIDAANETNRDRGAL